MALSADSLEALSKAFSGIGVCERTLITLLGKSQPEERQSFRKGSSHFSADDRLFERWDHHKAKHLKHEFLRFHKAMVLWTMHPWERDARLVNKALKKGPESYGILIEIACTRSSDDLLGARRAYHSLFDRSIEEDVASHIDGSERKLLVALVSAYRYEGTKVKDDNAKSEAKALAGAVKNADNDEVIRILATRSKLHLRAVYKHYKDISGNQLDEDVDELRLKETVQCLCTPAAYFSKVVDSALKAEADKSAKKGLTRVMVCRADVDMKEINEAYQERYGVPLSKNIEDTTNGNYKDLLLTLVAKGC